MESLANLLQKEVLEKFSEIKLLEKKIFGDSKIEYVLMNKGLMGSLSVLANYTYDFYILVIENENIEYNVTVENASINELKDNLVNDLKVLANY